MTRRFGRVWVGGTLFLAACSGASVSSSGYRAVELPYPLALESAVPEDVALSDLLTRDGCFYYRRDGVIHPVPSLDHGPDGASSAQPYCRTPG